MAYSLYINSVEYRMTDKYDIRQQLGAISSISVECLLESQDEPKSRDKVEIKNGATIIFFGFVDIVETPVYSTIYDKMKYRLSVQDAEVIFSWRTPAEVYINKTVTEIVDDLFDKYLLEEGLTKGTISTIAFTFETYVIPRIKLSDVLSELGDIVGATAMISPTGVFSFMLKGDLTAYTAPTKIARLKKTEKSQSLRTVQYMTNARVETSAQSLSITWLAGQKEIITNYPLSQEPTITINGNPAAVGVNGIDNADTGKTFLYTFDSPIINLNPVALIQPIVLDAVVVTYGGFYDVEIQSINPELITALAARNGTSGKIEIASSGAGFPSLDDVQAYADQLISDNSEPEEILTLDCLDEDTSTPGAVWIFDLPNQNITGNYIITERVLSDYNTEDRRVALKLSNLNAYSRYGTVLNQVERGIKAALSRGASVVIKSFTAQEILYLSEEYEVSGDLVHFPGVEPSLMQDQFYPVVW